MTLINKEEKRPERPPTPPEDSPGPSKVSSVVCPRPDKTVRTSFTQEYEFENKEEAKTQESIDTDVVFSAHEDFLDGPWRVFLSVIKSI